MSIISWMILGFLAGAIAKLIYPGYQGGGFFATTGLGVLGAIVGGYLGPFLLYGRTAGAVLTSTISIHSVGFAVFGAIILIFLWEFIAKQKS
ncbi:GlsB/YeaQ/YmgE family stress response membrane protein [Lusitaniella coriacea LEGE 07157]|uniref:GlsB/YeaQ/YmgE family stress response membrane protein n=1 Tax=Lusitaniella coriacea LEGE 07157 TaxID=945747 RepID=A0A8J7B8T8_9CYAN|nr:GlsB/YeaQ/YmgE family stress response membrane protein [Lusitaniella coriacea]MBE9115123.1 GlsB/YeaQ/YmgE family stress response membrane protein [Lusitaniella coriacea LEGE 07157]